MVSGSKSLYYLKKNNSHVASLKLRTLKNTMLLRTNLCLGESASYIIAVCKEITISISKAIIMFTEDAGKGVANYTTCCQVFKTFISHKHEMDRIRTKQPCKIFYVLLIVETVIERTSISPPNI